MAPRLSPTPLSISRASHRLSALAAAVLLAAVRHAAADGVPDPGNFLYTQSPSAPVFVHSYLVGYQPAVNGVEWDQNFGIVNTSFSSQIAAALNPVAGPKIHDADFFFQECFGGGMISGLPTALGNIPWVAGSAATYSQTALATLSPAPGVQPQYASWSVPLVNKFFSAPAQPLKTSLQFAYSNDFWGPNGVRYRETPQYTSYNLGNANTLQDAPVDALGGTHYGVVFVGDTSTLNQSMLNVTQDVVQSLINTWNGKPFNISILFGDGTAATTNINTPFGRNLFQAIQNFNATQAQHPNEFITLKKGTPGQLATTLATMGNTDNDQFLFFGFDHGGKYTASVPRKKNAELPQGTGSGFVAGAVWTDTFSMEDPILSDDNPNPNGELTDTDTEEDPTAPPTMTITYTGLNTSAIGPVDVLVNGFTIGALDPTTGTTILSIPLPDLLDTNALEIDDFSGENIAILSDFFDSGALPPEVDDAEAPEPASLALLAAPVAALLARRRKMTR